MRAFPLVKAARAVGWCPSFIPLELWHWWRWWTAGTCTTNGGGLCLRPDPRVPKPTTAPAAPRLPLLGDRRACTTTGSRRNERSLVGPPDALVLLGALGPVTSRIELGSYVVPTFPRHPAALAQQALTVQQSSSNRLALGIGLSHSRSSKPVSA